MIRASLEGIFRRGRYRRNALPSLQIRPQDWRTLAPCGSSGIKVSYPATLESPPRRSRQIDIVPARRRPICAQPHPSGLTPNLDTSALSLVRRWDSEGRALPVSFSSNGANTNSHRWQTPLNGRFLANWGATLTVCNWPRADESTIEGADIRCTEMRKFNAVVLRRRRQLCRLA